MDEVYMTLWYWNIAWSPVKWIEERSYVKNGRLYLFGNNMNVLKTLIRKVEYRLILYLL